MIVKELCWSQNLTWVKLNRLLLKTMCKNKYNLNSVKENSTIIPHLQHKKLIRQYAKWFSEQNPTKLSLCKLMNHYIHLFFHRMPLGISLFTVCWYRRIGFSYCRIYLAQFPLLIGFFLPLFSNPSNKLILALAFLLNSYYS